MTAPFEEVSSDLLLAGVDPARELALVLAVQFHREVKSDDPKTVVESAEEFFGFLTKDDGSTGKHAPRPVDV